MKVDMIKEIVKNHKEFSGAILVKENNEILFEEAYGWANKSSLIPNTTHTRFGMASGCKLFTSIAICQLIDKGIISINSYLKDCVKVEFPFFDPKITIEHLLTHTSGVPDYFDEKIMDDFSELWNDFPMYNLRTPKDFLPMFMNNKMEYKPGEKFKYNNSGFILLGLVVEEQTGMSFSQYVKENIFDLCAMEDSGYFAFDELPENTAFGYIQCEDGWKSNIYSLPVVGGPDGGAYTTVHDLSKLWKNLIEYKLLSKEITDMMLKPQVHEEDDSYYGLGVWIKKRKEEVFKLNIMGYDPGVTLLSSIYPKHNMEVTIIGNTEFGTWPIAIEIEELL